MSQDLEYLHIKLGMRMLPLQNKLALVFEIVII